MHRFLTFLIITLAGLPSVAQIPYQVDWKKDGLLMGSTGVMAGITLIINNQLSPLTIGEIEGLNEHDINWFDRNATLHFSSTANRRSDYGEMVPIAIGAVSPFILPVISGKIEGYGKEMFILLLLWSETNLMSATGTHLLKNWTKRARPFVYNSEVGLEIKQSISARKSFISGHTTASAANMFFLAKVFSDYFPQSKLKPYVWGVAVVIPAWTGFERYLAGKHFPTDIVSGFAFGALCGYLIPHMHKVKSSNKESNLVLYPYTRLNQYGLQMVLNF